MEWKRRLGQFNIYGMTAPQAGGTFKERLESLTPGFEIGKVGKPVTEVAEIPTSPEIDKKIEGYMEKIEKEAELTKPVIDDYTNQILLGSANPQNVSVTLPLTEAEVQLGLHEKIWNSFRWLAEWCVRQIKLMHGRVKYKAPTSS